jgi:putative salt-induced outer membrane protein YdiY
MHKPSILTLGIVALASLAGSASAAPEDAVAAPVTKAPAATLPVARADALELGRPDVSKALASLAGGADCCPPPACGCEPEWKGKVWGSFSMTSGNTDTKAAVFGAEVTFARDPWAFKAAAEFLYGSDRGATTAERYHALLRGDRKFADDRTYVFGQVTFDRDEPAGLEYRFIPTLGIGRIFFKNDQQEFKGEVGAGLTLEKRVLLPETTDPSGYVGFHYVRTWEDKRAFHADLDIFPNLNDVDLTVAKLAFLYEMPISDTFRVTAGLRLDYVVKPPLGRDDLDTLFMIGFSANF